jgi:hypothetical protein
VRGAAAVRHKCDDEHVSVAKVAERERFESAVSSLQAACAGADARGESASEKFNAALASPWEVSPPQRRDAAAERLGDLSLEAASPSAQPPRVAARKPSTKSSSSAARKRARYASCRAAALRPSR